MCGIAGLFSYRLPVLETELRAMGDAIAKRGPDDWGIYTNSDAGFGMVHRRLSIIDLSPAGHQPMQSACGRYVIAFNGEIYNHLSLRSRLEQESHVTGWRGHSDTETLLAAVVAWGLKKTLDLSVGMYALALWDTLDKRLHLARDRLGEKPLYYGWSGNTLMFASELKAFRPVSGFLGEVNRESLSLFMRHSYIPAPHSIYREIYKLRPGCLLSVDQKQVNQRILPEVEVYWSVKHVAETGVLQPQAFASDMAATDAFESLLRGAIRGQMVADVPLGAFLSGGIDSSAIVALMQAEACAAGAPPIKTFTIGFYEEKYNEAHYAKEVAKYLRTEHTELYVTPEAVLAIIPQLSEVYDEPFADSSQLPTLLLTRMTKQHVTVALSGDGGDELLGGYGRYALADKLWKQLSRLPPPLLSAIRSLIHSVSVSHWNCAYRHVSPFLASRHQGLPFGDKIYKAAELLNKRSIESLYLGLISHWDPTEVVIGATEPNTPFTDPPPSLPVLIEQLMLLDTLSYLPDDIMVKVDRAAMGVSLETRAPLLDHRLHEFTWRLPFDYKIRSGASKWLLRQVLYRHVPPALIERPKMGLALPLANWLRGPLRDWAESLLDESRLRREGYFDPLPIRRKWSEHLTGERNWQSLIWNVLMFQSWLERK